MAWWKEGSSFYTDAKGCGVEILSIDIEHKQFYLYKNASDIDVDGCDEFGEEHDSSYVSREVFDMLVEAVKLHGYKEKK